MQWCHDWVNECGLTDAAAAVALRDVEVRRGGRVVLDALSCDVAAGTVTGVVGPSGSGKTTMMRAVVGVQRHVSGTIGVLGLPAGDARLRRSVGYLTQTPSVYADISVGANLRYFAAVVGASARDVPRVLEVVGLEGEESRRVDRLSGGQRARVALASVLLGDPRVLVLDEPTVGLDPVLRAELWDTFRALARDGVTLLVSTHVMDEAARCDAVLLLRDGRLLTHETPSSLLDRTGAPDLDEAFLRLVQAQ
jgi:ABC-2 type transport system ATP-binding protein